jgi:hypothetical protein
MELDDTQNAGERERSSVDSEDRRVELEAKLVALAERDGGGVDLQRR